MFFFTRSEVRAPIPQKSETLVEEMPVYGKFFKIIINYVLNCYQ